MSLTLSWQYGRMFHIPAGSPLMSGVSWHILCTRSPALVPWNGLLPVGENTNQQKRKEESTCSTCMLIKKKTPLIELESYVQFPTNLYVLLSQLYSPTTYTIVMSYPPTLPPSHHALLCVPHPTLPPSHHALLCVPHPTLPPSHHALLCVLHPTLPPSHHALLCVSHPTLPPSHHALLCVSHPILPAHLLHTTSYCDTYLCTSQTGGSRVTTSRKCSRL